MLSIYHFVNYKKDKTNADRKVAVYERLNNHEMLNIIFISNRA